MSDIPKADELFKSIDYNPPTTGWMETPVDFSPGNWCYPAKPEKMEYMESKLPGLWGPAREWLPSAELTGSCLRTGRRSWSTASARG